MKLDFDSNETAFAADVRAFLAAKLTPTLRRGHALNPSVAAEPEIGRTWIDALAEKGWTAPGWAIDAGGPGWTPAQRWIFENECARAGAPYLWAMGERVVAPVIIRYGTPAQKDFYLPRILSGADHWCQGYSEPGAGSDLASLKTSAVRDRDTYVVNGSKIWTTHAHHANRMFTLVRTSSAGRKQEGISVLLIDMDTPGVTIRPILTIGGDHEVNQVFLDDVRVPLANRIGEEGQGWTYAKYLLEFERGGSISSPRLRVALEQVAALAADAFAPDSPAQIAFALRLSEVEIDIDALEMTELRILTSLQSGENPGAKSSLMKLRAAEIRQAVTRLGVEVLGPEALVWEDARPIYLHDSAVLDDAKRAIVPAHLNARATTIYGGSSEMQREIIARQLSRA